MEGHKEFVQIDHNDMFPYLLVNIGSGVSMIKVLVCWLSFRILYSYGGRGGSYLEVDLAWL